MNNLDTRPWGNYKVLLDTKESKVKLISVLPGKRMSYQSHKLRSEQWTVIKGHLSIILENKEQELETGDSIFIPKESKHRAWNKTNEIVKFIEVQTGSYFGEDDITRYEDDFNRL